MTLIEANETVAMVTVEQAIEIITRFQDAAPPKASAKLAEVMALLRSLDAQVSELDVQLQEATAAVVAFSNGAHADAAGGKPTSRNRTVTDQLADFFDIVTTTDGETIATAATAGEGETAEDESDDVVKYVAPPPIAVEETDPIAWLREAMPQLLLSDEEQQQVEAAVQVVSSRLKTAPIFDLIAPTQESLHPTMIYIRSQSERLRAGKMGSLTVEQNAAVRSIRDHADGVLSLLDAIEQVTALQYGKFHLQRTTFSCSDLIKRAREMMQASARIREHRILFYPPEHAIYASADFEASLGVLIDLLDNAIRYSPVGSVTRITINDLGSHVLINVADNGIGLSENDLPNVAKPFWRGTNHALVRENPGSGLRLYLAQRILAMQDGELIFSGESGVGSTFSFTLPVVAQ